MANSRPVTLDCRFQTRDESELKPLIRGGSAARSAGFTWLMNGAQQGRKDGAGGQIDLRLLTQIELLEQALIPVGIRLAQIIEQAPAHRHHLEEAATRGVILRVTLEVVGQLRDPAGEQCDLYIGAACVLLVELELLHVHRVTAFCHNEVPV